MKLGLAVDLFGRKDVQLPVERVQLAERLGYDSVWTAEAYGADALTPLAYLAAVTSRIKLATAVTQISARTPAATAMAFATIDALAGGGRVIAGLGLSGPQVVEGWYGQRWAKPIDRMRDYVAIMRKIWQRDGAVSHSGAAISVPYAGDDASGHGKPLKLILHPVADIPVYIAAGGPANVRLVGEIADGWILHGATAANVHEYRPLLEEGAVRSGRRLATLDIQGATTVEITDDVAGAIARAKPMIALYVGGGGSKERNFHKDAMIRRGYAEAAERIQELFLAGHKEEALAAIPDEYIEEGSLLGSEDRIAAGFERWVDSGVTGLIIRSRQDAALELMAKLAA